MPRPTFQAQNKQIVDQQSLKATTSQNRDQSLHNPKPSSGTLDGKIQNLK